MLTSIKVIKPDNTTYEYDPSQVAYPIDIEGMEVIGILNGDASSTRIISIGDCQISTIDLSASGNQTVEVSYQGLTATFVVSVKDSQGTVVEAETVSVRVRNNSNTIAYSSAIEIESMRTSVLDALKSLLDEANIDYLIQGGTYVSEIDGLGEFENGANSGWLYSVNAITPSTTASKDYKLKDGDVVLWYYTTDFTKDVSSSAWAEENSLTEIEDGISYSVIEGIVSIDKYGTGKLVINKEEIKKAIESNDKKDEATGILIDISRLGDSKAIEITLPVDAYKELISGGLDYLTVNSDIGKIEIGYDTLKAIYEETKGAFILRIDTSKKLEGRPIIALSITSREGNVSSLNGMVTVTVPYTLQNEEKGDGVITFYVDEYGNRFSVKDSIYNDKKQSSCI